MKKPWSTRDDKRLRRLYGRTPAAKIAKLMGRTISSVYQRANKIKLSNPLDFDAIRHRKDQAKKLYANGWSDAEVAAAVGISRRTMTDSRNRMGIPANGKNHPRFRARVAATTARQCAAAGVRNLGELRSKRFREFVASTGWGNVSIRSAQIAEALYRLGPMTRRQICAAIGMQWRGSRKTFSTSRVPGGSYMAELQRAGYVVRLDAAVSKKGKGRCQDLYMIGLDVEPCKQKL
jgi:Putative ATPase subunit of terminase (gpP-like)